ncbi:IS30 family transposase [Salininema proteolyticum]|uniref:IS30 family transposase n=1 Tax=Salininema proteolyticum TaxID=1607685 RepID=A0ABV8U527_9ACTN
MDFEVRRDRRPQGPRKLARERAAYLQLVNEGYSYKEACQIVGVNPRTGKRWRNGRNPVGKHKGAPPITAAEPPLLPSSPRPPSRYLHEEDRIVIADRRREGASVRDIARELERSPSTISRELRRNAHPASGEYRPHAAQRRCDERRPRPKASKIAVNSELRRFVQHHLDLCWSPEQISNALKKRFPDRPEMHVVHETIYQALYIQARGGLRREVAAALRTGRAMRKPHRQADRRRSRAVKDMVNISQRPAEVADRAVPGHWEGDLIIGKDGKSVIGTLVERATRYVMLLHLPATHDAVSVRDALVHTVGTLPAHLVMSLTWDQGSEMAAHRSFTIATNIPVYFCDPASPWQRGSNENTNGLLRQYFPKGTDLSVHDRDRLEAVAAELNSRPRKTLGWETPAERLAKLLTSSE